MPKYAEVIKEAKINFDEGLVAKAELLLINEKAREEIRFSWRTQEGTRFQRAPLDMIESDWLKLFAEAVKEKIFSDSFRLELIKLLLG